MPGNKKKIKFIKKLKESLEIFIHLKTDIVLSSSKMLQSNKYIKH